MSIESELAQWKAYLALVRVLQRNGVLDIADLVNAVGDTLDFEATRPDANIVVGKHLKTLYESLLTLEPHVQREASQLLTRSNAAPPPTTD